MEHGWGDRRFNPFQQWKDIYWLPLVLGLVITIAVLGLWQQLSIQEKQHIQTLVEQEAIAVQEGLSNSFASRIVSLERMANRWQVSGGTPQPLWEADASNYVKHAYGYQAIEWVDPSFHVRWVVPHTGNEHVVNLDLSQEPRRQVTLAIARDLRQTLLTRTISLNQGGSGFLACVPLFVPPSPGRLNAPLDERFDGFMIGVFKFQALFDSILPVSPKYKVQIYDHTGSLIYSQGEVTPSPYLETASVHIYGADWQVRVFPSAQLIATGRSPLPNLVLWGGIVSGWTLAFTVYLGQRTSQSAVRVKKINQQLQAEITYRQIVERQSEERWQLALNGTNDGIWDWNVATNEVFFSKRWKEMLGFADHEIVNHLDEWTNRVHPDDMEHVRHEIAAHFAKQTPFYISEHRMHCKDGSYKWVLDRGQALWNEAGKPMRMAGSHTDITEQKLAEIALRDSEAKYRNLINHLNAGFVVHAPDTHIMQCNASACRLLGLTMDQIFGKTAIDSSWHFLHEDGSIMPLADYPVNRVLTTGDLLENYILGIHRSDQTVVWVAVTAFPEFSPDGHLSQVVVTFIDISDRKRVEIALEKELWRSQMLFNISLDGVVVMDAQGNVVQTSTSFAAMLGYTVDETLKLNVADWDAQWSRADLEAMLARKEIIPLFETRHRRKDGSIYDVEISWNRSELDGQIFNLCVCRNISDRKRSEAALAESQKRYQNLIENSPDIIERFDLQLRHLYVSPTLTKITGIPADVFLGKTCRDLGMDDTMVNTWETAAQQVLQTGEKQVIEFTVMTLQGLRTFEMVIAPEWSDAGELESLLSISRDISDRKATEAALRQSEATKQAIIQAIPDLLMRMRADGTYVELISNSYFNVVTDLDEYERHLSLMDILPLDLVQIRLRYVQAALITGQTKIYEQEITIQGEPRYEEIRIVPFSADEVLVMVRDITERRQIELEREQVKAALLVSEERLKLALEVSENGLWDWHISANTGYISDRYQIMLGYEPGELNGQVETWMALLHPDDRDRVLHQLQAHLHDPSIPYAVECRLRCKSGQWKWIADYGRVVSRDTEGNPLRMIGIHQDIDTRKQVERQLQQQAEILQIFYAASPLMLGVVEVVGNDILHVSHNPATLEFFETTDQQMTGKWASELGVPQEHRQLWVDHYYQSQLQQQPVWFEYAHQQTSQTRWLSVMVSFIGTTEEQRSRFSYIVQDISERKRLQEERERSAAEHQRAEQVSQELKLVENILDIIQAGYWDWDVVNHLEYYSPGFKAMFGYEAHELPNVPETWQTLIFNHDLPLIQNCYETHIQSHGFVPFYAEVRYHHKNGSTVWVASSGQVIEWDAEGNALRMIGCHINISDRKQHELELRQAMEAAEAANLAKSAFLANMSHELRTPLNVILGFAQIMEHDPDLSAQQQDDLQTIRRSADHLLSLINNVLDLSKIEAGHSTLEETSFDLMALLHHLRTMMTERARSKRIDLEVDISPEVPQFVRADEQKLRQILLNLLSNAIKFTLEGRVTLRATTIPASAIAGPLQHPSCFANVILQFEVADTGVGIAETDQAIIFDAFVQAQAGKQSLGGTGLGLAISRKLAELMHGTITLNSQISVGSTFTLTIPICPVSGVGVHPEQRDRLVIGLQPGHSQRRILVVDDQFENRQLMRRIMTQLGLQVREASNGQEAVRIWQEWQPDLTWMDIRMPEMDGYEATKWIREFEKSFQQDGDRRAIPPAVEVVPSAIAPATKPDSSIIIALTAQASHSDRALALAAGCNDYISKPFQEATLFLKMREYLGLEYVYAESPPLATDAASVAPAPVAVAFPPLDTAVFEHLSLDWLYQLEDAAICGRDQAIADLTRQLPPQFHALGEHLRYLAERFEFEHIIEWLNQHPAI